MQTGATQLTPMVLALGGLMLGVGLAFKLSAVPFHFWCPDVFEGASAEVDAFLSVASKAAAMVLLLRIGLGLRGSVRHAPKHGEDAIQKLERPRGEVPVEVTPGK